MEIACEEALRRFYAMAYDPAVIPVGVVLFGFMISMGAFGVARADYSVAVGASIMLAMACCLSWPNQYGLDQDRLYWHHGIAVNKSVKLNDVDRIRPGEGKNGLTVGKVAGHWLSAGKKEFFIAGKEQEDLVLNLVANCPQLRQYGHEFRRELTVA